jgi:hypothetical protein
VSAVGGLLWILLTEQLTSSCEVFHAGCETNGATIIDSGLRLGEESTVWYA